MNYKDYINLGFTRHEMNDSVERDRTGYGGFSLEKELKDGIAICVYSSELDKPKLYIRKFKKQTHHIIEMSEESAWDLIKLM